MGETMSETGNHWINQRTFREPSKEFLLNWLSGGSFDNIQMISYDFVSYSLSNDDFYLQFDFVKEPVTNQFGFVLTWVKKVPYRATLLYYTNPILINPNSKHIVARKMFTYEETDEVYELFATKWGLCKKTLASLIKDLE